MSIMYILSAAFTLAVLRHRETFGSHPECNSAARLFFFGTRTVSHGWFVGMGVLYSLLLALAFLPIIVKLFFLLIVLSMLRKPTTDEERLEAEKQHERIGELVRLFVSMLTCLVYLTAPSLI